MTSLSLVLLLPLLSLALDNGVGRTPTEHSSKLKRQILDQRFGRQEGTPVFLTDQAKCATKKLSIDKEWQQVINWLDSGSNYGGGVDRSGCLSGFPSEAKAAVQDLQVSVRSVLWRVPLRRP